MKTAWKDAFLRFQEQANFSGDMSFDEPMSEHTTFRIGGPADLWIRPSGDCFAQYACALLQFSRERGIPLFMLGGGANILVASRGMRGIVLDTGFYAGMEIASRIPNSWSWEKIADNKSAGDPCIEGSGEAPFAHVQAGLTMDALVDRAAEHGFGGVEFLAGMPGSIGGAIWMNARCLEVSMSDVLAAVEIIDEDFAFRLVPVDQQDYSYKKSPFQGRSSLILGGYIRGYPRSPQDIQGDIAALRQDRVEKGHFRAPSAGSAFKNNRDFGKPTGMIIHEMGLRGFSIGGAQVAPWHGNFIINNGDASAEDVRNLVSALQRMVYSAQGFALEPEILFVGEWEA